VRVYNDIVQIAVCFSVQVTATGDETKTWVGQVAIDLPGRELALGILRYLIDDEVCGGFIATLNNNFVTGLEAGQVVEHSFLAFPVDMSGNDRRSLFARNRRLGIPTSRSAVYGYFHGAVGVQSEAYERGVHADGRNPHACRR